MGRTFITKPTTRAAEKLVKEVLKHGVQNVAADLGIEHVRLTRIIGGKRVATVFEAAAIGRAGIATLDDWTHPPRGES